MKNSALSVSIAIVTKNRPMKLKRCLLSLKKQSFSIFTILIIDNDNNQSASTVTQNKLFKDLKIKYYHAPKLTVPACRNRALKFNKNQYVAFIDDDCVADKDWLKKALETISNTKSKYVLGNTKLLNKQNIFAIAQHARDSFWKNYNGQLVDTKNLLIDANFFKNKKLKFDEKCQSLHYDSADFDLDFQVKKEKIKGAYSPTMLVWHEEADSFIRFKNRAFHRGKLAKYLNDKWKLHNSLVNLKDKLFLLFLLRAIKIFVKDYQKYEKHMEVNSFFKKIFATCLIKNFERHYLLGYVAKN
jgi:glycosyltransferase involved in cell wall biosynthesis